MKRLFKSEYDYEQGAVYREAFPPSGTDCYEYENLIALINAPGCDPDFPVADGNEFGALPNGFPLDESTTTNEWDWRFSSSGIGPTSDTFVDLWGMLSATHQNLIRIEDCYCTGQSMSDAAAALEPNKPSFPVVDTLPFFNVARGGGGAPGGGEAEHVFQTRISPDDNGIIQVGYLRTSENYGLHDAIYVFDDDRPWLGQVMVEDNVEMWELDKSADGAVPEDGILYYVVRMDRNAAGEAWELAVPEDQEGESEQNPIWYCADGDFPPNDQTDGIQVFYFEIGRFTGLGTEDATWFQTVWENPYFDTRDYAHPFKSRIRPKEYRDEDEPATYQVEANYAAVNGLETDIYIVAGTGRGEYLAKIPVHYEIADIPADKPEGYVYYTITQTTAADWTSWEYTLEFSADWLPTLSGTKGGVARVLLGRYYKPDGNPPVWEQVLFENPRVGVNIPDRAFEYTAFYDGDADYDTIQTGNNADTSVFICHDPVGYEQRVTPHLPATYEVAWDEHSEGVLLWLVQYRGAALGWTTTTLQDVGFDELPYYDDDEDPLRMGEQVVILGRYYNAGTREFVWQQELTQAPQLYPQDTLPEFAPYYFIGTPEGGGDRVGQVRINSGQVLSIDAEGVWATAFVEEATFELDEDLLLYVEIVRSTDSSDPTVDVADAVTSTTSGYTYYEYDAAEQEETWQIPLGYIQNGIYIPMHTGSIKMQPITQRSSLHPFKYITAEDDDGNNILERVECGEFLVYDDDGDFQAVEPNCPATVNPANNNGYLYWELTGFNVLGGLQDSGNWPPAPDEKAKHYILLGEYRNANNADFEWVQNLHQRPYVYPQDARPEFGPDYVWSAGKSQVKLSGGTIQLVGAGDEPHTLTVGEEKYELDTTGVVYVDLRVPFPGDVEGSAPAPVATLEFDGDLSLPTYYAEEEDVDMGVQIQHWKLPVGRIELNNKYVPYQLGSIKMGRLFDTTSPHLFKYSKVGNSKIRRVEEGGFQIYHNDGTLEILEPPLPEEYTIAAGAVRYVYWEVDAFSPGSWTATGLLDSAQWPPLPPGDIVPGKQYVLLGIGYNVGGAEFSWVQSLHHAPMLYPQHKRPAFGPSYIDGGVNIAEGVVRIGGSAGSSVTQANFTTQGVIYVEVESIASSAPSVNIAATLKSAKDPTWWEKKADGSLIMRFRVGELHETGAYTPYHLGDIQLPTSLMQILDVPAAFQAEFAGKQSFGMLLSAPGFGLPDKEVVGDSAANEIFRLVQGGVEVEGGDFSGFDHDGLPGVKFYGETYGDSKNNPAEKSDILIGDPIVADADGGGKELRFPIQTLEYYMDHGFTNHFEFADPETGDPYLVLALAEIAVPVSYRLDATEGFQVKKQPAYVVATGDIGEWEPFIDTTDCTD